MINAPSLANCNLFTMAEEMDAMIKGGVRFVHIDIMDGHYVPNIFFPLSIVKTIKTRYPDIITDVHLMVTNPEDYVDRMKEDGADYLSFHIDSTRFSRRLLERIRQSGMKAGFVLNPSQPVSMAEPLVSFADYVVLMTVEPGFAGQKFMPDAIGRLEQLQQLKEKTNTDFLISIDGGIDVHHSRECMKRGAEILISGIYTVFHQPDGLENACVRYQKEMEEIQKEAGFA
ncbi:ribulose-phosphate 3-epimerase [Clostridium sp. AM58-1XD]|uniref:ribulose-phosphate 3-epimerase n=1 Tax=Clostridium sp. AM58-1XD TaxID=2292307 RepID=UPI000E4685EB|nr:ribulose-phosphate 3-epimerase [Clostridium sp. AM58-1XD]RGZ00382.1 ribulose-phosphate 3-epimerase [Clostridium sp. AM58-1XD]